MKNSLTDGQTDRQTDDGHRVMGKALADIVSWAKKDIAIFSFIIRYKQFWKYASVWSTAYKQMCTKIVSYHKNKLRLFK